MVIFVSMEEGFVGKTGCVRLESDMRSDYSGLKNRNILVSRRSELW